MQRVEPRRLVLPRGRHGDLRARDGSAGSGSARASRSPTPPRSPRRRHSCVSVRLHRMTTGPEEDPEPDQDQERHTRDEQPEPGRRGRRTPAARSSAPARGRSTACQPCSPDAGRPARSAPAARDRRGRSSGPATAGRRAGRRRPPPGPSASDRHLEPFGPRRADLQRLRAPRGHGGPRRVRPSASRIAADRPGSRGRARPARGLRPGRQRVNVASPRALTGHPVGPVEPARQRRVVRLVSRDAQPGTSWSSSGRCPTRVRVEDAERRPGGAERRQELGSVSSSRPRRAGRQLVKHRHRGEVERPVGRERRGRRRPSAGSARGRPCGVPRGSRASRARTGLCAVNGRIGPEVEMPVRATGPRDRSAVRTTSAASENRRRSAQRRRRRAAPPAEPPSAQLATIDRPAHRGEAQAGRGTRGIPWRARAVADSRVDLTARRASAITCERLGSARDSAREETACDDRRARRSSRACRPAAR